VRQVGYLQRYFLMYSVHRFREDIVISQSIDCEDVRLLRCYAV